MDVTIVTYEKYPGLAPDDRIFRAALEAAGLGVRVSVWNDPTVDWSLSPVTVIREAWDYPQRYAEFGGWLDRTEVQTALVNSAEIVRWNMHKRYLAELAALGIAIVPTVFVGTRDEVDLLATCRERGWSEIVVKPCVGGSSYGAMRAAGDAIAAAGAAHVRALQAQGDVMIQPYVSEIEHESERAYIFIDGEFSHAVRKRPFNSSTVTTSEERHHPPAGELAFAAAALEASMEKPLYARVDVVPTARGPVLMELELIEPTLYFEFAPEAARRLADLLVSRYFPS